MMANVWPDGLMNQPRSDGILGPRRPRSMASRAAPSSHRRRNTQSIAPWMPESGSEPYQESRRALSPPRIDVGMASAAKPPRQMIRARRAPVSRSDRRRSISGVGSMPYRGRRWMTSVLRLGSSRWTSMGQTSSGRPSSSSAGASRPWSSASLGRPAPGAASSAGSPRGPGPDPRARAGGEGPPATGTGPRRRAIRPGPRVGRTGPAARRIPAAARTPGPAARRSERPA